jgi:hypothetical protein
MNCWKDTKTAFMSQMWFFGYLLKTFAVPVQEKLGHLLFLKRVVIPVNILSFCMQTLSRSYIARCTGFLLSGLCKLKLIPLSMILTGCVETKHRANSITFLYSFMLTVGAVLCVYILYVSKNAMYFLHFTNAYSILAAGVFIAIAVESPLRQLSSGNEELAKKGLNFISWFNSKASRRVAYEFDDKIKICATKVEVRDQLTI